MGVMKTLTINGTTYEVTPVVPALSVTLLADAWVKEGDTYSQVVMVEGVTSRSKVDLQPTPGQLEEFHYKVLAFVAENDGGKVTVYAIGDKPDGDHTIQVTLTEVEGTGKIRGNTVGTTMPRANLEQGDPAKADYVAGREEFANRVVALARHAAHVTAYGAKGDSVTNDTEAFQEALAKERVVYVPGGTYKLSSGLVIGDNCMLELAQDAVLVFTQTSGNCISLGMLSNLKGNHATVKVPYAFEGNVLYAYSNDTSEADINKVPPFSKWDPQWKSGRYVTDLNICKADSRGFHYAVNPDECKGAAVYLSADHTVGKSTFMWGIYMSGLRIAGAFSYGIRCVNIDNAWMHEMRIDNAFIDACEIGVSLEDCKNTYISAIIQPRRAYTTDGVYKPYAKHGIQLIRSRNTDLSGSRVWDWENEDKASTPENEKTTLWTPSGEYQHISMIGDCSGTIINDFHYHTKGDTRKRIYTDDDRNLETLTIIQEPFDRWFKVIGSEPYYNSGIENIKLLTEGSLDQFINIEAIKSYTDVLENATEADDTTIFNEIGYQVGKRFASLGSGTDLVDSIYYMTTGFIKVQRGQTLYGKDLTFNDNTKTYAGIVYYNANHERFGSRAVPKVTQNDGYWIDNYQSTANSFSVQFPAGKTLENLAYVRLVFPMSGVGKNPSLAIDETMEATYEGFLSDNIKVKGENIVGIPGQEAPDWVATKKETGGETIVIAEQTITSGMWSKRQVDIQLGVPYEVYVNGVRYTCVPYNYDGGIVLGNYTIASKNANVPHNNEPFYIYWAGGSATAGMFDKDSTLSYPITLKVTDQIVEVYNKMPEGYLPDGVVMDEDISGMVKSVNGNKPDASGNVTIATGGGGGADVTASVGQTIMVKEVDANGKPTKWEAVDYQPKICGTDEVELLPETEVVVDPDMVFGLIGSDFVPEANAEYAVYYNGTKYICKTFELDGQIGFGNLMAIGQVDTGEPFLFAYNPDEGMTMAASLDGSESFTVRIAECNHTPVPIQYVTNALPYYIDCTIETDSNGYTTGTTTETVENVTAIFNSEREIKLRATSRTWDLTETHYLTLSAVLHTAIGTLLQFAKVYVLEKGDVDVGLMLNLIPQEDGTYAVTSRIGD